MYREDGKSYELGVRFSHSWLQFPQLKPRYRIVNELLPWEWNFQIDEHQEQGDSRDVDALTFLAERGTLNSLQITGTDDNSPWEFALPPFRNLRKLVLQGMAEGFRYSESLAQVIVDCPELEELGLTESLRPEETVENHGQLAFLCASLHSKQTQNPNISRLKLKKLNLGTAYRPENANSLGGQYINWLTDLSVLEELSLQNDIRFEWHNERQLWEDFHLLDSATNLRRLTLGRLTGSALEFIHRMQSINPGVLNAIAGLGDTDNDGMESEEILVEGDELFAFPTSKLGPGWRKVSLLCALGDFAQHCASVEELSCYLPDGELGNFKTAVLPNLMHLRSLTIRDADIIDESLSGGQPLADELFRISYAAWEGRGCEGERLTRVVLGNNVYAFVFPRPGEGFDLERRRATRLKDV